MFAEKEAFYDERLAGEILAILELQLEEHALSVLHRHPDIEMTAKVAKIGKLGVVQRALFKKATSEQQQ